MALRCIFAGNPNDLFGLYQGHCRYPAKIVYPRQPFIQMAVAIKSLSDNKQPILVTGTHRSGSTWVGTVLGKSRDAQYIFEPFNKDFGPGVCRALFDHWYPYITLENETKYLASFEALLNYKMNFYNELRIARTRWQYRQCVEQFFTFKWAGLRKKRPLFKDPIALFSAPWLAERFNFQVVVLIRHPAAFAWSLKRLNWHFPFKDLIAQPLLMDTLPVEFKRDIIFYAQNPPDIIQQAILIWNVIHFRINEFQDQYKNWIFLRHEDLSLEPVKKFKQLFQDLGLPWTEGIENHILKSSGSDNPGASPEGKATQLKRNSRENVFNWKKRLTQPEMEIIKNTVAPVFDYFYPEPQWSLKS